MTRSLSFFMSLSFLLITSSALATPRCDRTIRLSSLLDQAKRSVPRLLEGLRQLHKWGVQNRTHSPYLRGARQIYHPRLNVRGYSPYEGKLRLLDQKVTYRLAAKHNYHWAEEPALYLPAPAKIEFAVRLTKPTTLQFGVGLMPTPQRRKGISKALVEVWLAFKDKQIKLFSQRLQRSHPSPLWYQSRRVEKAGKAMKLFSYHRISLEKWLGRKVRLRFVTKPPTTGKKSRQIPHVLVSNPVLAQHERAAPARGPYNLLVILVDTLRAKDLGVYGQKLQTSPNIDRFARMGTVFTHAYTVANRTRSSVTALLASEYPGAMGMHTNKWNIRRKHRQQFYQQEPPLLTNILANAGYAIKFIGNNYFLLNLYSRCLDLGFEHLVDYWKDNDSERITQASLEWLKRNKKKRFFLFAHYNDPHVPYRPPRRWMDAIPGLKKTIRRRMRRKYLGEVRRTDHYVGKLLQGLKKLGLERDTLVVFLADHGEVMYPHHASRTALNRRVLYNHGWSMYEEEYHVPLIFRLPGKVPANKRSNTFASLLDVAPTVLSLLGLPKPSTFRGRDLMKWTNRPRDNRPLFMEGTIMDAMRWGPWKYIVRYGRQARIKQRDGSWKTMRRELFYLDTDPLERHNLIAKKPKIAQKMHRRLSQHLREVKQRYREVWSKRSNGATSKR